MKKILVIEDDPTLQSNIADIFNEEGFIVFVASNGEEGVVSAIENLPDIIVCDISMPKMNGYDVLKALQEKQETVHIPFIFLTAKVQGFEIRQGMNLGADDYLTKPFEIEDLLNSVQARLKKIDLQAHTTTKSVKHQYEIAKNLHISKRELDVLVLMKEGLSSKMIADKLCISQRTVETHRANLMVKTNSINTAALINYALLHNLI